MKFSNRIPVKAAVAMATLVLAGCQTITQSRVSVDYYAISGNSTAALDREIQRKGPMLDGGRHAVAVARIRIVPNIKYETKSGLCRVSNARVNVDAKVTLPRWTGRPTASKSLGEAWDNIDRYTRLHESIHVAIAFRYAKEIENATLALTQARSCNTLKRHVREIIAIKLKQHDYTQKKFDADEQARFAKLAAESRRKKRSGT